MIALMKYGDRFFSPKAPRDLVSTRRKRGVFEIRMCSSFAGVFECEWPGLALARPPGCQGKGVL